MSGETASVDFYENVIPLYKGALEQWFVANKSLRLYFAAVFLTIWVVLRPNTQVSWQVFKGLPEPPEDLKLSLNYRKSY